MKLTGHTKLAIFVAPFLAVIGWIGGDIWSESQAMKQRVVPLEAAAGQCDIASKECILQSGEFQMSIYLEGAETVVNSTYPLDTMTLFTVNNETVRAYPMAMQDSPYYWRSETVLSEVLKQPSAKATVRVIATVKGGQYIAEVISTTKAVPTE